MVTLEPRGSKRRGKAKGPKKVNKRKRRAEMKMFRWHCKVQEAAAQVRSRDPQALLESTNCTHAVSSPVHMIVSYTYALGHLQLLELSQPALPSPHLTVLARPYPRRRDVPLPSPGAS